LTVKARPPSPTLRSSATRNGSAKQLADLAAADVTDFAAAVHGAPEERDRTIPLLSTARQPA